jgi:hypothetical protein
MTSFNDRPGKYCPFCGKPLNRETAKQCFKCGKKWHSLDSELPDWSSATPEHKELQLRMDEITRLKADASMNKMMIYKLGYASGMGVLVIVAFLFASIASLSLVGKSLFSGSQLTAIFLTSATLLLVYSIVTFFFLSQRLKDGVKGFSHLIKSYYYERQAAKAEKALRNETPPLSWNSEYVTTPVRKPAEFDVFLSHNSEDKPLVRTIADRLEARGLTVWLDERSIMPGKPWQLVLEQTIATAPAAGIMVGRAGLGPWQVPELWACMSQLVERRMPVIPMILPDAPADLELPLFLKMLSWVDLRGGISDDSLSLIVWAVTGVKPDQREPSS